jgi:hypothetical protein
VFRENETRYLVASAAIVWVLIGFIAWYEIGYNERDSLLDTIVAIGQGAGSAVAVTIVILASMEVVRNAGRGKHGMSAACRPRPMGSPSMKLLPPRDIPVRIPTIKIPDRLFS